MNAEAFARCIVGGGVAVFPADTVYGLACDPANRAAVERLYALKGRPLDKPSAVMFFNVDLALASLPWLGERTRAALSRLLPGGVTVLLPTPDRRLPQLRPGRAVGEHDRLSRSHHPQAERHRRLDAG